MIFNDSRAQTISNIFLLDKIHNNTNIIANSASRLISIDRWTRHVMNRFRRLIGANPVHVFFDRSTMKFIKNLSVFIQWVSTLMEILSPNLQVLLMPVCAHYGKASLLYITGIKSDQEDEFYGRYQLISYPQISRSRSRKIYLYQDGIHVHNADDKRESFSLYLAESIDPGIRQFLEPMIENFNQTGQNHWRMAELKRVIRDELRVPHGYRAQFLRGTTYTQQIRTRYGLQDVESECPLILEIRTSSSADAQQQQSRSHKRLKRGAA